MMPEDEREPQGVEVQDVEAQDVEAQDVETQDVETQDVETQRRPSGRSSYTIIIKILTVTIP